MHLVAAALSVLVLSGLATSSSVKERVVPPRGWQKRSLAPKDHIIQLRVGLTQPNFDVLEKHLYEVSDPSHERYGAHLSKEEVEELVAPHPEGLDAVNAWLASFGFREDDFVRSPAKDWISFNVNISMAEKMLDTVYYVWEHSETGDRIVRTASYSLPDELHTHIEVIQPTTMFAQWKGMKTTFRWSAEQSSAVGNEISGSITDSNSGSVVDASCNQTVTITCLQQLYESVGYTPLASSSNQIGITGYLGQFANIEDLQLFYNDQRPDALNSSFQFISVNGGINDQNASEAGVEANLDTQFAFGLTFPINSTFYSTAGEPPFIPDIDTPTDTNEPYTEWLDFVLSRSNPPFAISTSYGDDEQTVPESFATRVCKGFAQLGVRGVSLMASSGDGGVGDGDEDPATQTCFTNDGKKQTKFIPGFPASCPFITAVGGTVNVPETAVFFSGGGFSNYFSRPAYQNKAVADFFKILPKGTYEGLFNPNGRAIPDVSAQSDFFRVFVDGEPVSVGGTSASSPTFTGFVALLNDVRIRAGKSPLGFLNPLLYSTGVNGLNDITSGNAPGCGTPGFNATKGWDPVTGLGTPNFAKLKGIVVN